MQRKSYALARTCALGATCLALNVGLGKASNLLGLPFTCDTIGTILGAALLPAGAAFLVAGLSSALGSIFIHPAFIYYIGTQFGICLAAIGAVRWNLFSKHWKAVLAGIGIGVISAVLSSPVTAIVFQGVSVPSLTALNVVFLAAGNSLIRSVVTGSLIVESIDKAAAGLIVWLILTRLPRDLREHQQQQA